MKPYDGNRGAEIMFYWAMGTIFLVGGVLSLIWYLHHRTQMMGDVTKVAWIGFGLFMLLIAFRSREMAIYEVLYWLALMVSTFSFVWRVLSIAAGEGYFAFVDLATFVVMVISFVLIWREPRKSRR